MGGPQKLMISEIVMYLKEVELVVEDVLQFILALDEVWMTYYVEHKAPKKGK